MQNTKSQLR